MQDFTGRRAEQPQNARTNPVQSNAGCSGDVRENENPGALAGATGTDIEGFWSRFDHTLERRSRASAVIEAVLDCEPADRAMICETILDQIRPGFPQGYSIDLMHEASFWADASTRRERKAYLWAIWQRLPISDQSAFLGHVQGRAAA